MYELDLKIGDLVEVKHFGIEGMFLIIGIEWNDEDGWLGHLQLVGEAKAVGWLPLGFLQEYGQKMTETNKTNKL